MTVGILRAHDVQSCRVLHRELLPSPSSTRPKIEIECGTPIVPFTARRGEFNCITFFLYFRTTFQIDEFSHVRNMLQDLRGTLTEA